MTTQLSNLEFSTAYQRWCEHWPVNNLQAWSDFLGGINYHQYQDGIWYCEDDAANKIRQLNSPHYRAIIKAYLAHNEIS